MRDISPKKILIILGIIALVVSIPLTISFLRRQQELRSRAGGEKVSLALSPQTTTKIIGESLPITVILKAKTYSITGVDVSLIYDKDVLQFVSFIPTATFNNELINKHSSSSGTLRYVAVDTESNKITGDITLGTLTMSAKAAGTGTVVFQDNVIQVVALGVSGLLPLGPSENGSYIVTLPPTPTPTPTVTPSPTPTPTLTPTPTPTLVPTATPTLTPTPTSPPIGEPTGIPTLPVPTNTPTPIPSPTPSPTPTPTSVPPTNTPTPTPAPGDVDGDGTIGIEDFNLWRNVFLGLSQDPRADLDKNGVVDLVDFNIWRTAFLGL